MEFDDSTLVTPVQVTVTPPTSYQGDYGLEITKDPDYVTAMDILAAYVKQEYGEPVSDTLDVNPGGWINTILGSTGSSDPSSTGTSWEFRVNDCYPTYPDQPGTGSLLSDTEIHNGDVITLYGSNWMAANNSYATFTQSHWTGIKGGKVKVTLQNDQGQPVEGATILCDPKENAGSFALTETSAVTNAQGVAYVPVGEVGEFVLSATRTAGGAINLSRPYATVTVSEGDENAQRALCQQDADALSLPTTTAANLALPNQGDSEQTTITWTSDAESVLDGQGKVTRPAVGASDAVVHLTARVAFSPSIYVEKNFTVTVEAYTQAALDTDLAAAAAALTTPGKTYFQPTQYDDDANRVDTNLVTALTAKASAAVGGASVTLADASGNAQIAADGAITYGAKRVKGTVELALHLAGQSKPVTLDIWVPASLMTRQEAVDDAASQITFDKIKGNNEAADKITSTSLSLLGLSADTHYTNIAWTSSNPDVISVSGNYASVKRPNYDQPAVPVTLTAEVSAGAMMDYAGTFPGTATPRTVTFDLTVLPYDEAECRSAVDGAYDAMSSDLQIKDMGTKVVLTAPIAATYDLSLPSVPSGSKAKVAWSSNNGVALTVNGYRGKVARSADADQSATLTATLSLGGYERTLDVPVTVKKLTAQELQEANQFLQEVKTALTFDVIRVDNTASDHVVGKLQPFYRASKDENGQWVWGKSNNGEAGAQITWSHNQPTYLDQYLGVTRRPADGEQPGAATLTATLTHLRYAAYGAQVPQVTQDIAIQVAPYDNTLAGLSVDGNAVQFDRAVKTYEVSLSPEATSCQLTISQADPDPAGSVLVDGVQTKVKNPITLTLDQPVKTVTIQGISQQTGKYETYTLTIKRVAPLPDYDSEWDSFRGQNGGQTEAYTPRTGDEAQLNWTSQVATGFMAKMGSPILVNDTLFIAQDSELQQINKQTGVVEKRTPLASSINLLAYLTYGDGMLFVPLSNGCIQALNAQTLESLWISKAMPGHQTISPLVYRDGYLYTGTFVGNVTTSTDGAFFCLNTADENPALPNEEKDFAWTYKVPDSATRKGFYWSGAAVTDNAVLFGSDSGLMISHTLTGDAVLDTFQAQGDIRSSITYDPATHNAYFTTTEGHLYAVQVRADGTFGEVRSQAISPSTSTPLVYNGRIYITGGHMTADGLFTVLDAQTLNVVYTADLGDISQSSPLLTTAYANAANDYTVYIYVTLNARPGGILCIQDSAHNTIPNVRELYTPESGKQNYCLASVIADHSGNLYYTNDSGNLFSVGNQPIQVEEVKLAETEGTLEVGKTLTLTPEVLPATAPDKSLLWSSSDETVAAVENGVVRAVGVGTATITARAWDAGARTRAAAPEVTYTLTVTQREVVEPTPTPTATAAPTATSQPTAVPSASPTEAPPAGGQTPQTGDTAWLPLLCLLLAAGSVLLIARIKRGCKA